MMLWRWQYWLSWLFAKSDPERCRFHVAWPGYPVYWNFTKPVQLLSFGSAGDDQEFRHAVFDLDAEGGSLSFGDGVGGCCGSVHGRVRLFPSGQVPQKWRNRFRRILFRWSADYDRVLLEIDGETVAAADFTARRIASRPMEPQEAVPRDGSNVWDDALAANFTEAPRPTSVESRLTPGKRFYVHASAWFSTAAFLGMLLLVCLQALTPFQGFFAWFWLRTANNIVRYLWDPYDYLNAAWIPDYKPREVRSFWSDSYVRRQILLLLAASLVLLDILPPQLPLGLLISVYIYPAVLFILLITGVVAPTGFGLPSFSFDDILKFRTPAANQAVLFLAFQKKHFPRGRLIIGQPDLGDANDNYFTGLRKLLDDGAGQFRLELEFVTDGVTSEQLDRAFASHGDAACLISLSGRWQNWKETALYRQPPEERPAIFLAGAAPGDFTEVFREIRAGRLAGAGIEPSDLKTLDLNPLLPPELRPDRAGETPPAFFVDRDNLDGLIDALVDAGYKTFARLRTAPEEPPA